MSHNLHFAVIRAESPKDACNTVENEIMEFGNENNWRTICGCVSEKNKVFVNDKDGRYSPEGYTIAKINRTVMGWMKSSYFGHTAKNKLSRSKKKIDLSTWDAQALFSLEKLAKDLYQTLPYRNGKKFNVLEDEYYAYQYDECGVTQIETGDEGQIFIVFVDMHS